MKTGWRVLHWCQHGATRTMAEANSAEAAIKQAKGAGDLAIWSKEKILLQGVAM